MATTAKKKPATRKPVAKKVEKKREDKMYRLRGDIAPIAYMLKVGRNKNLTIHDEDKDVRRAIRHCPNEKSIFVDEQSEHAVVKVIIIEKGYITVPASQPLTQDFLDAHPDNGRIFESIDLEKEAEEAIEYDEMVLDLKLEVKQKLTEDNGILALEAAVSTLRGSVAAVKKMKSAELKRELFIEIDSNPYNFVDDNGNPNIFSVEVLRGHTVLKAIDEAVIKISVDNSEVYWGDSGEKIIGIPSGLKPVEFLTEYLGTDAGMLIAEEITKRL